MDLMRFLSRQRRLPEQSLRETARWFFSWSWLRVGAGLTVTREPDGVTVALGPDTSTTDELVATDSADATPGYLDAKVQHSITVNTTEHALELEGDGTFAAWEMYGQDASAKGPVPTTAVSFLEDVRHNDVLNALQKKVSSGRVFDYHAGAYASFATDVSDVIDDPPEPLEPDDPDVASGLLLWLKADTGVFKDGGTDEAEDSDAVYQWSDQSGNGNHASQTASTKQPAYDADAQNGLPAVDVDGVDNGMSLGDSIEPSAFTIYLAIRLDSVSSPQSLFRKEDSFGTWTSYALLINGSGDLQLTVMDQSQGSYPVWTASGPTTGWQIIDITFQATAYDATDATLYLNGTDMSPSHSANGYASGFVIGYSSEPAVLGFRSDAAQATDGAFGECLVYGSKHDDDIRAGIRQYLSDKWDIALS